MELIIFTLEIELMKILDHIQIKQKIKRLAYEILEHNYEEKVLILAGINNNGHGFAKILKGTLSKITDIELKLCQIQLNPANPVSEEIKLSLNQKELKSKSIILIDDVANTGRTLFYAAKPLMDILPKKVEVAVLVDRKHKSFPIAVTYTGISLATTLKENINVQLGKVADRAVYLED